VGTTTVAKLCMLFYRDYENFDPTPRKEEKLLVFKSRILKSVYEPETEGVVFGWKTFYGKGLHDLILRYITS
jgi:hypothetical protein